MIDALGNPQSLLVLGATSDIARATVDRLATGGRLRHVVLAGRDGAALTAEVARVRALGVESVQAVPFDAEDLSTHDPLIKSAFAAGDIDVVLLAFGILPDDEASRVDVDLAVRTAHVNYVGAGSVLLRAAGRMREQGHGSLVVLSSVAGQRARRSNYVYGSSKAGIDVLATGLGDDLADSGVSVLVVRPGFVKTKMTVGRPPAPLSVGPERVADAVAAHLSGPSRTIWVPTSVRYVMAVLGALPRSIFRRLPI